MGVLALFSVAFEPFLAVLVWGFVVGIWLLATSPKTDVAVTPSYRPADRESTVFHVRRLPAPILDAVLAVLSTAYALVELIGTAAWARARTRSRSWR